MMRLLDKMNFNHLKVATVSQSAGAVLGRGQWGEEVGGGVERGVHNE